MFKIFKFIFILPRHLASQSPIQYHHDDIYILEIIFQQNQLFLKIKYLLFSKILTRFLPLSG